MRSVLARLVRVALVVVAIVALYPAGSILLARLGVIAAPEQQGVAHDPPARSDGTRAGAALEEAVFALVPDRAGVLDLGHAIATDASGRLGLRPSTAWSVEIKEGVALPAGVRVVEAVEVRPECGGGASSCTIAMRLHIAMVFHADGSVRASVSWQRGTTGQPQKGWAQQYARSHDGSWLRAETQVR